MERTAKDLVAEIYPKDKTYRRAPDGKEVKRGRKFYEAAEHVLNALVAGSTTLVSDLSLSLADNASVGELKNRQEQVSGWLKRYDFEDGLNDYLMARAKPIVGPTTTHPLLANLRSLIGEERIRNIAGRPRKPPEKRPEQLELAFPDAA